MSMLRGHVVSNVKESPKGCHMVLFYNSRKEKHQIAFSFVEYGLEKGEAVIYLSDEQSPKQIIKDMSNFGVDVGKNEKTGALKILTGEEWYVQRGTIQKGFVLKKWMKAFSEATEKGFCGLRVSGEPTYFFKHDLLESWMGYERSLPRRFDVPLTVICRYRTRDLASYNMSYLLELVRIHSHTITPTFNQEVDFPSFFQESVDSTFNRVLGKSGTQVVYHFLEDQCKLPKSEMGEKMSLFIESLFSLFGPGGKVLQREVLKDVCSKLGLTSDVTIWRR